jgi:hypothetical protein
LMRLRKLAKKIPPPEASRHNDLWLSLISTFSLFEKKEIGEKLGIMSLQGDLFGYNAILNNHYDLHQCSLSNTVILNIIKSLSYFENENQVLIAVNYGGLDVEEFGSVYEGLLELKLTLNKIEGSEKYSCNFDSSNERGKSGSHYTPEELVQPLIKHSLEYLIEDRLKLYQQKKTTKDDTVHSLLSLKICDVACGSGHILLSAARRVALEIARVQTEEEQPNPLAIRKAMKDVIKNCIYGVDKNPLAIELCKIALWLEAYNPGEPLNFLDHHIKCGDAIVGLAHRDELENGIPDEAFKTLAGDDKDIAKSYRDKNIKERKERVAKATQLKAEFEKSTESSVQEAMAEYKTFNQLPENTPEEIERKAKAYKKFIDGKGFIFLKAIADTQVAQFFIPKTDANKDLLLTDGDFRQILSGYKGWQDRKVAKAVAVAYEQRIFHWFIEFPEVFNNGGFDCVLGNPPFLGGTKIGSNYGDYYFNSITSQFKPTAGRSDLVTYFFRRIFNVINSKGFLSLISTNTISQGETKAGGLDVIISQGGKINFSIPSTKWPGLAAVQVSLISITRRENIVCYLNSVIVDSINSNLSVSNDDSLTGPFSLHSNLDLGFLGSYLYGEGFIVDNEEARHLLMSRSENRDIIFPYLIGQDLNSSINQTAKRQVINFFDWDLEKASKYPECLNILKERVKPQRDPIIAKGKQIHEYDYWKFWDKRLDKYESIKNLNRVLVISRVSKTLAFAFVSTSQVFADSVVIIPFENSENFSILQSSIHNAWIWEYCTTMKTDPNYGPSNVLHNFPIPRTNIVDNSKLLIGETYHEHRRQLMLGIQLGLTKTYNLFHSNAITTQSINDQDKQVASLLKHLEKTPNTISFNEALQGILKLRELHVQMDSTVSDAYGWNDIELNHDFYEVDYLPENDRVRFTIHPDARKEVLKRLLELNHKIHEEEVAAGLWDTKPTAKAKKKKATHPKQNELF